MKLNTILLVAIEVLLLLILVEVKTMRSKMDEVLTNAAECGDIDCDDGYSYAASRIQLEGQLRNLYDPRWRADDEKTSTEL